MNARSLAFCLMALPGLATAQGFAGLGTQVEGFTNPEPSYVFDFPTDHGPHPDFRIEWWYLTATLRGADGLDYGIQWTLFRSALAPETRPGWQDPQLWMGHAAITTPTAHHVAERLGRGGIGQAGAQAAPFRAWIDDWTMQGPDFNMLELTARGADFSYDLDLIATAPLVFHGQNGYSVKSPAGQASYYYSQPSYRVTGTLRLPDKDVVVTGNGWLDREWSSQPLAEDQSGWDWFSLSFDSGAKMMAFRLRDSGPGFTSATWITPEGTSQSLPDGQITVTPLEWSEVAGRQVPTNWRLTLPAKEVDVTLKALNPQSWMATSFPYWEGPISINGSHAGRGYLEMTGYE